MSSINTDVDNVVSGMDLSSIEALLSSKERFAIFSHNNPDPDSISSAIGLAWILKKKFMKESKIFYGGEISHQQNKTMVNVLEIPMHKLEEYKPEEFDCVCLVDSTTQNAPIEKADLVLDHHRSLEENAEIKVLEPVGACATLIWEMIKGLDLSFEDDLDSRVATALFFGIRVDTRDLISENVTDRDYQAVGELSHFIDRKKLAQVIDYPLPVYLFDLERILWAPESHDVKNGYFVGSVGIISSSRRDCLPILADKMVRMEGVVTALVFAIIEDHLQVSVRSMNTSLDVNTFCKQLFGKEYSGGKLGSGGACVPLGLFSCKGLPEELALSLWETSKKLLFHKILNLAEGK